MKKITRKLTTNQKLDVLIELVLDSYSEETILNAIRSNNDISQIEHGFTHKVLIFVIVASFVGAAASIITLAMA